MHANAARREAFAQAVARGAAPRVAWLDVGYKDRSDAASRSKKLSVTMASRILEIRIERHKAAQDLAPLIEEMVQLARDAVRVPRPGPDEDGQAAVPSPAAINAARAVMAEVGKLKIRMADFVPPSPPPEPPMSTEAWLSEYGPQTIRP